MKPSCRCSKELALLLHLPAVVAGGREGTNPYTGDRAPVSPLHRSVGISVDSPAGQQYPTRALQQPRLPLSPALLSLAARGRLFSLSLRRVMLRFLHRVHSGLMLKRGLPLCSLYGPYFAIVGTMFTLPLVILTLISIVRLARTNGMPVFPWWVPKVKHPVVFFPGHASSRLKVSNLRQPPEAAIEAMQPATCSSSWYPFHRSGGAKPPNLKEMLDVQSIACIGRCTLSACSGDLIACILRRITVRNQGISGISICQGASYFLTLASMLRHAPDSPQSNDIILWQARRAGFHNAQMSSSGLYHSAFLRCSQVSITNQTFSDACPPSATFEFYAGHVIPWAFSEHCVLEVRFSDAASSAKVQGHLPRP